MIWSRLGSEHSPDPSVVDGHLLLDIYQQSFHFQITFKRLNLQLSTTKKREVDNDEILSILVRSIRKEIYVASYCKGYP